MALLRLTEHHLTKIDQCVPQLLWYHLLKLIISLRRLAQEIYHRYHLQVSNFIFFHWRLNIKNVIPNQKTQKIFFNGFKILGFFSWGNQVNESLFLVLVHVSQTLENNPGLFIFYLRDLHSAISCSCYEHVSNVTQHVAWIPANGTRITKNCEAVSWFNRGLWIKIIEKIGITLRGLINPFLANVPILYPLKTPENQKFSGVFRGYKIWTLARNGLRNRKYVVASIKVNVVIADLSLFIHSLIFIYNYFTFVFVLLSFILLSFDNNSCVRFI